ncbi:alcohol acetyltransferase [Yarrowia lipolytica]|nr:alcohol acetyltransferase [Yarrowia lipolytica]
MFPLSYTTMSRKLGPHETYAATRSRFGSYSNVFVSARLRDPAPTEAVEYAVCQLIHNEPILGVTITGDKPGQYEMHKLNADDYDVKDFLDTTTFWDKQVSEAQSDLHYVRFDLTKAHWKVVGLDHGREVLFLYDHTLLDGMSGSFACRQLVKSIEEYRQGKRSDDNKIQVSQKELPPPVEKQITVSAPVSRLVKELANEYLFSKPKTSLPPQVLPWTGYYGVIDLTTEQTSAFLKMCKAHSISGGAGLYGLLVCSSSKVLHDKYPDAVQQQVSGSIPWNARKFTPGQDPERLGMVVGESLFDNPVPKPADVEFGSGPTIPSGFLEVAKVYQDQIKKDGVSTWFSGYPFMHIIGLIPFVDLEDYFASHTNNYQRHGMYSLSNLTALETSTTVERLRFSQCTGGTCPFIQFSTVGIKGGPISISVAVAEDDSIVPQVEKYVEEFLSHIS